MCDELKSVIITITVFLISKTLVAWIKLPIFCFLGMMPSVFGQPLHLS